MVSVENERVRRKYFKDLNRKVYIERALEIIRDEGTEAISIRRMAKEFQCSTTSMYRYFENVEELLYYANLGYLDEYLEELNVHEKEWRDIWDMHIGIWECYCRIAFRYPQAFDIIFFSTALWGRGCRRRLSAGRARNAASGGRARRRKSRRSGRAG